MGDSADVSSSTASEAARRVTSRGVTWSWVRRARGKRRKHAGPASRRQYMAKLIRTQSECPSKSLVCPGKGFKNRFKNSNSSGSYDRQRVKQLNAARCSGPIAGVDEQVTGSLECTPNPCMCYKERRREELLKVGSRTNAKTIKKIKAACASLP